MVTITIEDLTQKVNEGWKKKALAEHYELPMSQMTKVLQQAGLKIRKFHAPKFELVSSATVENADTAQVTPEAQEELEQVLEEVNDSENNSTTSRSW